MPGDSRGNIDDLAWITISCVFGMAPVGCKPDPDRFAAGKTRQE